MNSERNLNIINDMKGKILEKLLSDEDLMKLVTDDPNVVVPAVSARYDQVVPWRKIFAAQEESKCFVSFDVTIGEAINCAARSYGLCFWISVPYDMMPFDKQAGTKLGLPDRGERLSIISDKIDYLLNGLTDMGFGRVTFLSSGLFHPIDGFCGRNIYYAIDGWNRYGDKL